MERGHVLVYCIISAWQICYKLHSYQLLKSIIINHTCNLFNIYLQCKMSLQKCSMYFLSLLPGLAWHVVNKLNYLLEFEHSHKVTRLPKNLDNHKNKVDLKNEDILNNRDKIHPQRHLNILNWEGSSIEVSLPTTTTKCGDCGVFVKSPHFKSPFQLPPQNVVIVVFVVCLWNHHTLWWFLTC